MNLVNVIHVFITFVVLLQAPAYGGLLREFYRKFLAISHGDITFPCLWWLRKAPSGTIYHSCNLCAWGNCNPVTMLEYGTFNPTSDAQALDNAINQPSGENDDLTNILIHRSEQERNAIADAYKTTYSVELRDRIKPYVRNQPMPPYENLMRSLATPLHLFFAEQFADAMTIKLPSGRNKQKPDPTAIVEMLTSLPRCLIIQIIDAYKKRPEGTDFTTDLNKFLADMPHDSRILIERLANEKRDQRMKSSWIKALVDAYRLQRAVRANHSIKIYKRFSEVFTKRSFTQIIETMNVYENLRIEDEGFKSVIEDINTYLVKCKDVYELMMKILTNKPLYYANVIERIFKREAKLTANGGYQLIALIRGRLNIDLKDIIDEYNKQSKGGLQKDFESWASAQEVQKFREAVVKIITP